MKRTYRYALGAIIAAATIVPAIAQDNFPDVPANHWAYEALAKMKKDGLLVGYPDGLFRGPRPASRYELAVAVNAVYMALKNQVDGLDGQLKALTDKVNGMGAGTDNSADIKSLRGALTALQSDVNGMKGWGDDIASLKRMMDTFQNELKGLGVDVEAIKKDLGDINDRLTKLEKRKPAVDISGDVNLWVAAGNSRDGMYGLNKDGRINGTSQPFSPFGGGGPVGLTRDASVFHEGAFTFAGTNETGPKWRGTLVVGNLFGDGALGNQSSFGEGFGYMAGPGDVYLNDFGVKFDTSVAGLAFNAEVGRVGYKINPYIFQRPDNSHYFSNERWDNGNWMFDGGILGFNFGGAKLDVFAGRNSNVLSTNGAEINPVGIGNNFNTGTGTAFGIDRSLGLNLNVPLTTNGNLNLAYLWLDSDVTVGGVNRVNVFGGSADFNFNKIKVEGGYSKTTETFNTTTINDSDNAAWNVKASYYGEKWGIWGGYREIENNYVAPGDWGRLGILRNPANIKGFQVGGALDVTSALSLHAGGEFDKGKDNLGGLFNTDSKVNKYNVSLNYNLSSNLGLMLGYEWTQFQNLSTDSADSGDSTYKWTTIGLSYGLSSAAKLSIMYELSDVDNELQGLTGAPGLPANKFRGGFLTSQLSIKF